MRHGYNQPRGARPGAFPRHRNCTARALSLARARTVPSAKSGGGFTDVGAAGTEPEMSSVTIDGLPEQSLTASLLRVACDPLQRARFYEALGGDCHQCRNTLNSLRLSLYLARRGPGSDGLAPWTELEANSQAIETFVERLQWLIKPIAPAFIKLPLSALIDEHRVAWSEALLARGRELIRAMPPKDAVVAFDPFHLGRALDAFVRWRAETGPAGKPARIGWGVDGNQTYLEWSEGKAAEDHPAWPGVETLALPLVARVIVAHGGSISVNASDGLCVGLRWPIDASSSREEQP